MDTNSFTPRVVTHNEWLILKNKNDREERARALNQNADDNLKHKPKNKNRRITMREFWKHKQSKSI